MSPSSISRSTETASRILPAACAGIAVRFARWAPTATNTASKPSALKAASISSTLVFSSSVTPISTGCAAISAFEHLARQAVFRDAEAHHAAGHGPRLAQGHPVA